MFPEFNRQEVLEALRLLGIERLILAIHDQSFPSKQNEEIGRGSPYSNGGMEFCRFIHELGFNGVQFGPQGKTTLFNASPYDGTIFSRNELSISIKQLCDGEEWHGILDPDLVNVAVADCPASHGVSPATSYYTYAWHAQNSALRFAFKSFMRRRNELSELHLRYENWQKQQALMAQNWLERDRLFEALSDEHGTDDWRAWPSDDQNLFLEAETNQNSGLSTSHVERIRELHARHEQEIGFYTFCQFVAHEQHMRFRRYAKSLGLKLYGDMQIGYSPRDTWSRRGLFFKGYAMGAPPSRTNPDGQPWGYPVLDPHQLEHGAADFMRGRAEKMLTDFDGIRIDHPHGLVCPWVYRADTEDSLKAVQGGARMFESPDLADHPRLKPLAIPRPEQINETVPRYADGRVVDLDDKQVQQYATFFETVISLGDKYDTDAIFCEVLSTCPYPLHRVMQKFGLGRFRVTQKSDLNNSADVYRSENASREDLIMVGNHDTKPLKLLVEDWFASGAQFARAEYLAERLIPQDSSDGPSRAEFAAEIAAHQGKFLQAMFAELFASPATNVSIFFADLLGMKDIYNKPGTVSDANWAVRVPSNYLELFQSRALAGEAMCLPTVLKMALRAKFPRAEGRVAEIIERFARLESSCGIPARQLSQ